MKNPILCSLLLAGLAVTQSFASEPEADDWGPETNHVQMYIGLKGGGQQIKTNQAVILLVRLRNISTNETFNFYQANATERSPGFAVLVVSPSGKDISPKTPQPFHGSGQFIDVGPGQTRQFELRLSYLCKLEDIGTYRITAQLLPGYWPDKERKPYPKFRVTSNPLNISIVSDH